MARKRSGHIEITIAQVTICQWVLDDWYVINAGLIYDRAICVGFNFNPSNEVIVNIMIIDGNVERYVDIAIETYVNKREIKDVVIDRIKTYIANE